MFYEIRYFITITLICCFTAKKVLVFQWILYFTINTCHFLIKEIPYCWRTFRIIDMYDASRSRGDTITLFCLGSSYSLSRGHKMARKQYQPSPFNPRMCRSATDIMIAARNLLQPSPPQCRCRTLCDFSSGPFDIQSSSS